jgi:hypothetical protein
VATNMYDPLWLTQLVPCRKRSSQYETLISEAQLLIDLRPNHSEWRKCSVDPDFPFAPDRGVYGL